jgi:hypothetical protein
MKKLDAFEMRAPITFELSVATRQKPYLLSLASPSRLVSPYLSAFVPSLLSPACSD